MSDVHAFRFANPSKDCDLIMKGGVTSGVVFPQVICQLATDYRFRNIGGTSAGAIGAVMAAAAEYRRQTSDDPDERGAGFERIALMPEVLAANLPTFFQPSPRTKPLLDIGMATIRTKSHRIWAGFFQTLRSFAKEVLVASFPGVLVGVMSSSTEGAALGSVLILIGILAAVGYAFYRAMAVTLPANDFGLCSGLTQPGMSKPAFTDWITDEIEAVAGRSGDDPLTVGDLLKAQIHIASVTTDLSSRRPYELPFGTDVHCYRKSEFEQLFPARIMRYLLRVSSQLDISDPSGQQDYFRLPPKEAIPVAMIARMSLSFPGLIQAVPLYRLDQSLIPLSSAANPVPVRCLFSDGGITSNFPIHMFDSLLPGRPTFGISLASYDQGRHGDQRVYMPNTFEQGADDLDRTPVLPVHGLFAFVAAILSTARNWQDTLQSQLHGYSERIVEIRLDDSREGGLNLDMDDETVGKLSSLGREAGETILHNFSFNEHRWRRTITALPTLAQSLQKLEERYDQAHGDSAAALGPGILDYRTLLGEYQPTGFADISDEKRAALQAFAEAASMAGTQATLTAVEPVSTQSANLRVTASMETTTPPKKLPSTTVS